MIGHNKVTDPSKKSFPLDDRKDNFNLNVVNAEIDFY